MVSDQEIARGIETLLLRQHPLHPLNGVVSLPSQSQNGVVTYLNDVVTQLGAQLGIDLSHKAEFIADHINNLVHYYNNPRQHPHAHVGNDHFALHNYYGSLHPHFVSPHFTLPYAQYAPPQQHHVLPRQQGHVSPSSPPQTTASKSACRGKASKDSTQPGTKKRGGSGGLNKLSGISPELQVIVGEATMARTEIVKKLWAYIRSNKLQDPSNKRKIICDEALRAVFETDCTDMFKMNKLLSKHILPLDPTKGSAPPKRQKLDVDNGFLPSETVVAAETAEVSETSQGPSPIIISDALAHFLGTTSREMLASEAIQHVCEYVKVNSLEDPTSMSVICDEKLRELFGCERIPVLEMNETLTRRHLLQSW